MSVSFNNYTVTDVTINNLNEGDNVSSLYPSASITLSPNMGYYLDASWFSLASTADHIDYATFTQDGENVICTLYFQTEFIMPAFNVDIPLCLGGAAELKNFVVNADVYSTPITNCSYDYTFNYFPLSANYNAYNQCWTASITANAGYYFETLPVVVQSLGDSELFTIEYSNVTDSEGRVITRYISIYYTTPNYDSLSNTFSISSVASEIFVPVEEITGYSIDSSAVPDFGALRTLTIFGSVGTPWWLDTDEPILQTGPADPITGLIPYGIATYGTIGSSGYSSILVNIGAVTVNTTYSISLVGDLSVGFSQPLPIVLNQFANTTITYTTTPYALFVNDGDKYNTGGAFSSPLPGMDGYSNVFNWQIFANDSENDYGIILISQPSPSDFDNLNPATNGGSSIGINSIVAEQTSPGFVEMQITGAVGTYGSADMTTTLDLTKSIAYIDTYGFIDITTTTVQSGGEVTYGGTTGTFGMKGLCYSTSTLPTVADNTLPDTTGFGSFISSLEGLTPNTTYYVRAYGYNSLGVVFYGPEKTFTTLAGLPFDIDVSSSCSGGGALASMDIVLGTGVTPYSSALAVFNSEAAALANTTWSVGVTNVAVGVDPSIVATYWLVAKDGAGTIVTKSVNVNCTVPVDPMDMNLFQACSGDTVTYVGADTITGGVAPYYKANTYFTSESAALANTSWSSTPNDGSVAFDYAVSGFGDYWIAIKDSNDTVLAKGFYADCWNSVAAPRNLADLSANAYFNSTGACGSGSTQNIYIAYRNPGTLAVGDRIFVASSGIVPFNGTVVSEVQNWWKFNDSGIFSACPSGTTVRINNDGWITDITCCP